MVNNKYRAFNGYLHGHCEVCFYYLFIVHIFGHRDVNFILLVHIDMRQKQASKSMHVEAALFGEDIESILKLTLKFAMLAKPNQQTKSVNNHNKNTSKP